MLKRKILPIMVGVLKDTYSYMDTLTVFVVLGVIMISSSIVLKVTDVLHNGMVFITRKLTKPRYTRQYNASEDQGSKRHGTKTSVIHCDNTM